MADPRIFISNNAPAYFKCQVASAQSSSDFRNFSNAVNKVGDLSVLNGIAGGAVGAGLRTLASASNSIRTGCGALPTSIGSSLSSGANWVLQTSGIDPSYVTSLQDFNPGVANVAYSQAQQIFQQVQSGNFKTTDIPNYLQDLQNLQRLGSNIYTPSSSNNAIAVDCTASPYAMDLIARQPKHKFLFVVQFIFQAAYTELTDLDFAFVVKKSSRPTVKFKSEDVNYYNFRTKVNTMTEFEPMTMTFHDDTQNYAMRFYNAYRNAMSPVTNINLDYGLIGPEQRGMQYDDANKIPAVDGSILGQDYSASRGPLEQDSIQLLKSIRLFHVYDAGRLMNLFEFSNPRMTEMSFDDLDMSVGNEGTEMTINFDYDSVFIKTDLPMNDQMYMDSSMTMPGQGRGVVYPLRYNDSASATDASNQSSVNGTATQTTTSCDPMQTINTASVAGTFNANDLITQSDTLGSVLDSFDV